VKHIIVNINKNKSINNKLDIYSELSDQLEFPGWCGTNWDAMLDCLSDLEWLDAEECECIIVVHNATHLQKNHPDLYSNIRWLVEKTKKRWKSYPRSIKIQLK
jgi:RNAse (barnase) inhibitor barstar